MPEHSPAHRRSMLLATAYMSIAVSFAATSSASAGGEQDAPFDVAAVSPQALGDTRGHGLADSSPAAAEVRLGIVLWDEVPPTPRRPTPRNTIADVSAATADSVRIVSSTGPGD